VRDRKGGIFSMQFKPNADFDVTTTGFYSRMSGENYGRLQAGATYSMLLGKAEPLGGTAATSPNTVNAAGQQVFASIRNPVIVDETTVFGDHLRVLKAADIVIRTARRRSTSATPKASSARAPKAWVRSSTWTASGAPAAT
jgi:iron complex outermembrane receptor protein